MALALNHGVDGTNIRKTISVVLQNRMVCGGRRKNPQCLAAGAISQLPSRHCRVPLSPPPCPRSASHVMPPLCHEATKVRQCRDFPALEPAGKFTVVFPWCCPVAATNTPLTLFPPDSDDIIRLIPCLIPPAPLAYRCILPSPVHPTQPAKSTAKFFVPRIRARIRLIPVADPSPFARFPLRPLPS